MEIDSELPLSKSDVTVLDLQHEEHSNDKDKSARKTLLSLKDRDKSSASAKDKSVKDGDRKDRSEKDKDRHRKHDSSSSSSRDKHKSSSSSRKHRHRSSEHDKHRSRSRHRSAERSSHHRSRSSEKSGGDRSHRSKSGTSATSLGDDKERHRSISKHSKSRSHKTSSSTREKSADRKEESATASIAGNESPTTKLASLENADAVPAELLNPFNGVDVDLSDMEPTSTVTIQTPPQARSPEIAGGNGSVTHHVWKGTLCMPDVAEFHTALKEVSGNCEGLEEDLKNMNGIITCVGRIKLPTVWDYISKVKKIGSKEIVVLRFEVFESEDNINYLSLYSYLSTKNRLGVVGDCPEGIKDFYIMPLANHAPVPQVLLPLDGPGFEDHRAPMLLAIMVRSRRRRYHASASAAAAAASAVIASYSTKKTEHEPYVPVVPCLSKLPTIVEGDSFTPPHSPTSVFVNTQVPTTLTIASEYM